VNNINSIKACICCGSTKIELTPILWRSLIDEWRLSEYEVDYINMQQGLHCIECQSNLRSMVLAYAIMAFFRYKGWLKDFIKKDFVQSLKILEINEAGQLTPFLSQLPGHRLEQYPQIDIMNLPFSEMTFDIVVHSDVLEHVKYPLRGLSECLRVLKQDGFCAYTVPVIIDRFTISREGLAPSYHGSGDNKEDFLVYTEYGCDAWKQVIQTGFNECRIFSINFPASLAFVAVKN
jgi:SAM-dependent methyltransferase